VSFGRNSKSATWVKSQPVSPATQPRFVDTDNPSLAVECPSCQLLTPRFLPYCRNCGFALWDSGPQASAAFTAWRRADPGRARARRYDLGLPAGPSKTFDYDHRAHELGIHLPGPTRFPILICLGFLLLGVAGAPLPSAAGRIALAAIGASIFLLGVVGWVVIEDARMFPKEDPHSGRG
jgi:hypothetical protein